MRVVNKVHVQSPTGGSNARESDKEGPTAMHIVQMLFGLLQFSGSILAVQSCISPGMNARAILRAQKYEIR